MDEITTDWEITNVDGNDFYFRMKSEPVDRVQYEFEPFFTASTTFMLVAAKSAQKLNLAAVEGGTYATPAQLLKFAHEARENISKPWNELTYMPASPYSEQGIIWLNEVVQVYGGV